MADDMSTAEFESNADDETWHEIEELVDEIAVRSRETIEPAEFYQHLLTRTLPAVAAPSGTAWLRDSTRASSDPWQVVYHVAGPTGSGPSTEDSIERLNKIALEGDVCVSPGGGHNDESTHLTIACPVRLGNETVAIVELEQRPRISPAAQRGYVRLLSILSELASDFHRNHRLQALQASTQRQEAIQQFSETVHGDLDFLTTAFRVANEGRRVLDVDRCSLATVRRQRARLEVVSGLDQIDRRANSVRNLERLVEAVVRLDEPLWYVGHREAIAPQLESLLQAYLDESHARVLAIIPLKHKSENQRTAKVHSALIVEHFDRDVDLYQLRSDVGAVARSASPALRHAMTMRDLPLRSVMVLLAPLRFRHLPKTVTALLVFAALICAGVLLPADFVIVGRGEVQPVERQDVFAPTNAQVTQLFAVHAQEVKQNQKLAQLQDSRLDIDVNRVVGEIETNQQKLDAVNNSRNTAKTREELNQLDAEKNRLQVYLKSLNDELSLLRKQQQRLTLVSPIRGQVLTWNVDQRLDRRPVQRGQRLMTVVNTKGPWELLIQVPDHHIGHVLDAQNQLHKDLTVSFVLGLEPGQVYQGKIESVAFATEVDALAGSTVQMRVSFDAKEIEHLRPGASVVVRIHCGQRPIGYVWLHDLIDAIRTRWF